MCSRTWENTTTKYYWVDTVGLGVVLGAGVSTVADLEVVGNLPM